MPIESDNGSNNDSTYSVSSDSDFNILDEGEYDDKENNGVSYMARNQIIAIESLCQMICKNLLS